LMTEIRAAVEIDQLESFVARFRADRARGV
jgi:hypothetical protein